MNEIFKDYPDIVTPKELQEMLHIGRSTAYSLLKENKINHIRIGNKYIIPKQYVMDFCSGVTND